MTINNLLPGPFDTERLRSTIGAMAKKAGQSFDAAWDARKQSNPTRRFGVPDEFGAACAFLCSEHAGYIVAQNWLLDGGMFPGN